MSSLTGSRTEEYFVKLLDKNDQEIRVLKTSKGGTLNFDRTVEIQSGGKLTVYGEEGISWANHRVQPWIKVSDEEPRPLGVFLATAPTGMEGTGPLYSALELHDKTIILDRDKLDSYYTVPKNANVVDSIISLIESTGQSAIDATASSSVMNEMLVFEPGTRKLEAVNTLLTYINYEKLWVNEHGRYQVRPDILSTDRPLARTFQRGKTAIHKGRWERDMDISSLYNKVVLVTSGSGEFDALIGTSVLEPSHKYSYETTGNWVTYFESGIEAETPAVIKELARRKLVELTQVTSTIDIEHLMVPLNLGDLVRLVSHNIDSRFVVERMSMTLTPGSLCQATWREVVQTV